MKRTFLAAALTVVACLAGASGAAAAAAPADEVGPQVVVHSSLFLKVGSVLSDSSPSAYIPATITWTATDPSGICGSQWLSVSDAGEGYDEFEFGPSVRQFVGSGSGMETEWIGVSLYAEDCAGNAGIGETFYDPSLYQETAATYTGRWSSASCACWTGGVVRKSTAAGATATFAFHGGSVALIGAKASNRGSAKIYVDGVLASTVSAKGATANRVVVFSKRWATHSDHTLKVVVASGRFDIDGFVVVDAG